MESVKTPFDVSRDIFTKTTKFEKYTADDIAAYSPYIINRACSMVRNPRAVFIINDTVNRVGFVGSDKELHFKLLQRLLPLCGGLRFGDYIKTPKFTATDKADSEKERENLLWYSTNLGIPYKELVMYRDEFGIEFEGEDGPKRKKKAVV